MLLEGPALRNAVRFAEILQNTQTYSPAKMQAYQRRLLDRLLRHAKAEVPFYETRLNPLFGPKDEIRWEAWEDIPTFTRGEAQEAEDALFARNMPAKTGSYRAETTSGSTGMPLKIRCSGLVSLMSASINQRIFDWHGVDTDNSFAFILDSHGSFAYPEGLSGKNWNFENPVAPGFQLSISSSVKEQVEWLSRRQPDILSTYPRNAVALVEAFKATNQEIPFRTLFSQGEILEADTRKTIEDAGIRLIDRFGSEEAGPLSAQCTHGPWHHQFAEVAMMEVLAPATEKPVFDGTGSLIVTPFYNYAMPLIRYENGDQIEVSTTPCACGRSLPRIERILGRDRNMFTFSDGTRIWPHISRSAYEPFLSAKQFQFIQHTFTDIEVIYVPDKLQQPVKLKEFSELCQKVLHQEISIRLTRVNEIPRTNSGKYEAWKSYVLN